MVEDDADVGLMSRGDSSYQVEIGGGNDLTPGAAAAMIDNLLLQSSYLEWILGGCNGYWEG